MSLYLVENGEKIFKEIEKAVSIEEKMKIANSIILKDSEELKKEKLIPYLGYVLDLYKYIGICATSDTSGDIDRIKDFRKKILDFQNT